MRKRRLWEILSPNPPVRYAVAEKLNVGHWMRVVTPYGTRLQFFEHGIGKEGGTSIILRQGYSGNMRTVSHDPAEYLIEKIGRKTIEVERVLFLGSSEDLITISNPAGTVRHYDMYGYVLPRIGYDGYGGVTDICNDTKKTGVILIREGYKIYWYVIDKSIDVVSSGVLDGLLEWGYTYLDNKLRVAFDDEDGNFVIMEWINHHPVLVCSYTPPQYLGAHILGRHLMFISYDGTVTFHNYETGSSKSFSIPGAYGAIARAAGNNVWRIYVGVRPDEYSITVSSFLNMFPDIGYSRSLDSLLRKPEGYTHEFIVSDTDVIRGFSGNGYSGSIIAGINFCMYATNRPNGALCSWVQKDYEPYFDHQPNYSRGVATSRLSGIDYDKSFRLSSGIGIFREERDRYYGGQYATQYTLRIVKDDKSVAIVGHLGLDGTRLATIHSFDTSSHEIYLKIRDYNYNMHYFRVTENTITRISKDDLPTPTLYSMEIGNGCYLIWGISDVVKKCGDVYYNLEYGGPYTDGYIVRDGEDMLSVDSVDYLMASNGEEVRWAGVYNGVRGEYVGTNLVFAGYSEEVETGRNYCIFLRHSSGGGVSYYIADSKTLLLGGNGLELPIIKPYFFDFYEQDTYVFGAEPVRIQKVEVVR